MCQTFVILCQTLRGSNMRILKTHSTQNTQLQQQIPISNTKSPNTSEKLRKDDSSHWPHLSQYLYRKNALPAPARRLHGLLETRELFPSNRDESGKECLLSARCPGNRRSNTKDIRLAHSRGGSMKTSFTLNYLSSRLLRRTLSDCSS